MSTKYTVGVFDEKQLAGLQMAISIFLTHRLVGTLPSNRGDDQVITPFLIVSRMAELLEQIDEWRNHSYRSFHSDLTRGPGNVDINLPHLSLFSLVKS